MSYNPIVPMQGKEAATDLAQYLLVKTNADKHELCTAATDIPEGATYDQYEAGQITVLYTGGSVEKLTAAGAIAAGAEIMPAAAGKVQEAGAVTGSVIVGKALFEATADEQHVVCLMYERPVVLA